MINFLDPNSLDVIFQFVILDLVLEISFRFAVFFCRKQKLCCEVEKCLEWWCFSRSITSYQAVHDLILVGKLRKYETFSFPHTLQISLLIDVWMTKWIIKTFFQFSWIFSELLNNITKNDPLRKKLHWKFEKIKHVGKRQRAELRYFKGWNYWCM